MNDDEKHAFKYLKTGFGENVAFEPDGKVPPDFVGNSTIAVESRRLNKHFFEKGQSEGLEQLSIPLVNATNEVLRSFDSQYKGDTYFVSIKYKRPLKVHQAKVDMLNALTNFLEFGELDLPCTLETNSNVKLTIYSSQSVNGRTFQLAA
ncbi:MAG TPA: hypothetical protein VMC62_03500, partial [Longilinea sp.]|nr:hypothetical protein [Longilinea sp.]